MFVTQKRCKYNKRIQLLRTVCLILLFAGISFSHTTFAAEEKFDFRKTRWGMTKEEIMKAEITNPVFDEKNAVAFSDKVADINVYVFYIFVDNVLVSASYLTNNIHSNTLEYISDYDKLFKILKEKYGEPVKDKTVWRNDLFRNDPQSWGTAVAAGHLAKSAEWDLNDTKVILGLTGDNYKIIFGVLYQGKKYKKLVEEQSKKENEAKF